MSFDNAYLLLAFFYQLTCILMLKVPNMKTTFFCLMSWEQCFRRKCKYRKNSIFTLEDDFFVVFLGLEGSVDELEGEAVLAEDDFDEYIR